MDERRPRVVENEFKFAAVVISEEPLVNPVRRDVGEMIEPGWHGRGKSTGDTASRTGKKEVAKDDRYDGLPVIGGVGVHLDYRIDCSVVEEMAET